jgi:hypothetical protein
MNNFVELYRASGQPATASVTMHASVEPAVGDSVTIGGQAYVFGTHFTGSDPMARAKSLVAAINAEPNTTLNPVPDTQPIKNYYAVFYGRLVRLISTHGGVIGNSITLATSNAAAFIVSGATFTGGVAAGTLIP